MTEENIFATEICDERNKNNVRCQFCGSLILKPRSGHYTINEYCLPLMHQKNTMKIDDVDTEIIKNYWCVDDMFTFENIGFSNTVQDVKFLICADCEMGPVGYHDIGTKKSYIALKRVKHV